MKKITAILDQAEGMHARFGHEGEMINTVLETLKDQESITLRVATCTQLLLLDIKCHKEGWELEVFDEDGNKFATIQDAHRYVCDEYIFSDLFDIVRG